MKLETFLWEVTSPCIVLGTERRSITNSHAESATLVGKVKKNVDPRPEFALAQIRPPC